MFFNFFFPVVSIFDAAVSRGPYFRQDTRLRKPRRVCTAMDCAVNVAVCQQPAFSSGCFFVYCFFFFALIMVTRDFLDDNNNCGTDGLPHVGWVGVGVGRYIWVCFSFFVFKSFPVLNKFAVVKVQLLEGPQHISLSERPFWCGCNSPSRMPRCLRDATRQRDRSP